MSSKDNKESKEFIARKRENSPLKTKNFEDIKQNKIEESGIIYITYRLDKNLFNYNNYIRLFGENFVKNNKNRCNIIIAGKEYEIISIIDVGKLENYGINKEDEAFEVILKGEEIKDISYMFKGSENLIKADLSSFNTQNVIDMRDMFDGCTNLIKADLSSFNTQNVIDMRCMFNFCQNLVKVDISSFNTQNVTDMRCMFNFCKSLLKIDLSSFNTKNVTNVSRMFVCCESIIKIRRKNFNKTKNDLDIKEFELLSIIEI